MKILRTSINKCYRIVASKCAVRLNTLNDIMLYSTSHFASLIFSFIRFLGKLSIRLHFVEQIDIDTEGMIEPSFW